MMNIFCLDVDPLKAANYHRDADLSKMIAISTKILEEVKYGVRHPKPNKCVQWAAASVGNYVWLRLMASQLCVDFKETFGFEHPSYKKIVGDLFDAPTTLRNVARATFPMHMPLEFLIDDAGKPLDAVSAHRRHYLTINAYDMTYRCRPRPTWLENF